MRRISAQYKWMLSVSAVLTLLVAALVITGTWPFEATSSRRGASRHVVWEGDVALQDDTLYALDVRPRESDGDCSSRCLAIHRGTEGHLSLAAGNGIQGWTEKSPPSFVDCIILRNRRSFDSVALGAPRTAPQAVALHGWACATGGRDGLLRLRYDGTRRGHFDFFVTSWGMPPEG